MKSKLLLIAFLLITVLGLSACAEVDNVLNSADLTPTATPAGVPLFSFIIYGDNGTINPVFEKIVGDAADPEISFLICAGDITNGKSLADLQTVKKYLDQHLDKPYYVAIGDNDLVVDKDGRRTEAAFTKTFGTTKQSFDWQNSHFTIFDSTDGKNSFSDEELAWLENDLRATDKKLRFLVMHIPIDVPLSDSSEINETAAAQNKHFSEIINRYHVSQIYTGHFHGYLNYDLSGIPVAVTGGGGSAPQFGLDPDYHYLRVDVYPDTYKNNYVPLKMVTD